MAGACSCCGIILGTSMSIKVTYRNGVFEPVEDVTSVRPGQNYTAFSDEELAEIRSTIGLNAAEKASSSGTTPTMPCTTTFERANAPRTACRVHRKSLTVTS